MVHHDVTPSVIVSLPNFTVATVLFIYILNVVLLNTILVYCNGRLYIIDIGYCNSLIVTCTVPHGAYNIANNLSLDYYRVLLTLTVGSS